MDLINQSFLPEYALDYLDSLKKKGRQDSTIKRYGHDLTSFFTWIEDKRGKKLSFDEWRQLSKEQYNEFFLYLRQERKHSDKNINRIFIVLKRMAIFYNSLNKKVTVPTLGIQLGEVQGKVLAREDLISKREFEQLERSIKSQENLSKLQLKSRHLIVDRNLSIMYMLYYEGLTLRELVSLKMKDINFVQNTIRVESTTSNSRTISIPAWRKKQYYQYYKIIPEPVRPKMYSNECFFCAFHFQLKTYEYVYDGDIPLHPKGLTEIGVQRMIQKEVKRAGLRKGLSSQHCRNSAIINSMLSGYNKEETMNKFGFKSEYSFKRYLKYVQTHQEQNSLS